METQQMAAPLDTDLASIDISMPLLADGIYDLRVEKVEMKTTAKGKQMIHLDLVTTAPGQARNGGALGAGIHVFNNVNVEPSGKATWDLVKRSLAELVQAAKFNPGEATLANVPTWAMMLQGRMVRAKVGFRDGGTSSSGKSYKPSNEVSYFMKS